MELRRTRNSSSSVSKPTFVSEYSSQFDVERILRDWGDKCKQIKLAMTRDVRRRIITKRLIDEICNVHSETEHIVNLSLTSG